MSRHRDVRNMKLDDYDDSGYYDDEEVDDMPYSPSMDQYLTSASSSSASGGASIFDAIPIKAKKKTKAEKRREAAAAKEKNMQAQRHLSSKIEKFSLDTSAAPANATVSASPPSFFSDASSSSSSNNADGPWTCDKCTLENDALVLACLACTATRPEPPPPQEEKTTEMSDAERHAKERADRNAAFDRNVAEIRGQTGMVGMGTIKTSKSKPTSTAGTPLTVAMPTSLSTNASPLAGSKSSPNLGTLSPPSSTKPHTQESAKRAGLRRELLAEEKKKDGKPRVNVCIIGHVDAGKSTLMGQVMVKMGKVSQKQMRKFEKDSAQIGKGSFALAWVMDEHEEERERGVTVDVAVQHFETDNRYVTILDSPGHKDFIPNMITGAARADSAVLVIGASKGEFERGFEGGGQTKEHAILARSLGVKQIIVAVNKLDTTEWSKDRFDDVAAQVTAFLQSTGFKAKDIWPIPVSGLHGINVVDVNDERLSSWYKGKTLMQMIDSLSPPEAQIDKPFRFAVTDVVTTSGTGTVTGQIMSGSVMPKDRVLLMPNNELVSVKTFERLDGEASGIAVAGENINIILKDVSDINNLMTGQILCDPSRPIPLVSRFRAQIITMDYKIPLLMGSTFVVFTSSANSPAYLHKLVSLLDKTCGAVIKKRPRALPRNASAVVDIEVSQPMCVELYREMRQFGRISLRRDSDTVAVGIIIAFSS